MWMRSASICWMQPAKGVERRRANNFRPRCRSFCSQQIVRLAAEYSAAICCGSFDEKSRLSSQHQQVMIAADQEIGLTTLSQIEKRLIARVSTHSHAFFRQLDHFAVRKILGQELATVIRSEPEFRISEDAHEFRGSWARD